MADQILVLLLEDDDVDADLITRALGKALPGVQVDHARTSKDYLERLAAGNFDAIVSDSSVPGCEGMSAFHLAREHRPGVPFIYVSSAEDPNRDPRGLTALGVNGLLTKSRLGELSPLVQRSVDEFRVSAQDASVPAGYETLASIARELALARSMPAIMAIVRHAARELTGADGATFVLREGDFCRYVDEEAIGPLWKGQKVPLKSCLSGWSMLNRQPAVVEDILEDTRVPAAVYETTFVRSIVTVPIRSLDPVGAIGAYWSEKRTPQTDEISLLQALADHTAVAMENVRMYEELQARLNERTAELDSFMYAISHDLRTPIRHAGAFAAMIFEDHGDALDADAKSKLQTVCDAVAHMSSMVNGLLDLSRLGRAPVKPQPLDLAALAQEVAAELKTDAARPVEFIAPASLPVSGDRTLLRSALRSLLGNAWKFSSKQDAPRVELGVQSEPDREPVYFVRDNGAGFDENATGKLFKLFQRLHTQAEFPGTGVGLVSVQRIVEKHGGSVWAAGKSGEGATFYFTLGK